MRPPERREMFINEKILIRLMRQAQKGTGVYIGCWDGWYTIGGSYWKARIGAGCLPRTVAAAMVELSGDIPREGEAWTADKSKNQIEAFDTWEAVDPGGAEMYIRPMWLATPGGTPMRVLQREDNRTFTFPDALVAAAFGEKDKKNEESQIAGPIFDGDGGAFWCTNQAAWHIRATHYRELDEIITHLDEAALAYTEGT